MPKVFISYRRADSSPYTGRLFDRMVEAFGKDKVFMDVDSIDPGVDFDDLVRKSVASCDVLLAVIGPQWLTVQGANGNRRLDNPDDIVRHEIATALGRDTLVIPVLMGGAAMPTANDLPEPIKELTRRNAVEVRDTRFHDDVNHLLKVLTGKSLVDRVASRRMGRTIIGVIAAVILSVGGFFALQIFVTPTAPPPVELPAVSAVFQVPPEIPDYALPFKATVTNASAKAAVPDVNLIAFAGDKTSDQNITTEQSLGGLEPNGSSTVEGTLDTSTLGGKDLIFKAYLVGERVSFKTGLIDVVRKVSQEDEGRVAEQEKALKEALDGRERSYGPDHPRVAGALDELAAFYVGQSRFADAEPLYARALKIRESALGDDHPEVAQSIYNLAAVYVNEGRFDQAAPLFNQLVAVAAKQLGPEHPDVARFLSGLADVYMAEGKYELAEPLYNRVLAIREKALGPEHIDVGTTLYDLALLRVSEGKMNEAKTLLERVLAIAEKALGPESPRLAGFLTDLAGVDQALGDNAAAERHYKRAIAIQEKALGPDHPDLVLNLENLAGFYDAQNRYAEAEEIYRRVDAISGVHELKPVSTADEVEQLIESVRTLPDGDPERRFAIEILWIYAQMGQEKAVEFLENFEG
jgi:tetratricopeptide (TPR) repeat protein